MRNNHQRPSFAEEEVLAAQGYRYIAGIDEVGCGALAGPVVAAAVILLFPMEAPWLEQVNDSKKLTPVRRQALYPKIGETAITVGIGITSHDFIETNGLTAARRLAMSRAIDQLSPPAEFLLIDQMHLPQVPLPQKGIIKGDGRCLSIACASIMAKVTRDRMMVELDRTYPGYGLARHKGYGTNEHLSRLRHLGPCPVHRRSFRPVRDVLV